jgi:hypothetical protein
MGVTCNTHREMRNLYNILVGKSERSRRLGRPRLKLEGVINIDLKKGNVKVRTGFSWLKIGTMAGSYEYSNESSISMKGGNFLTS